MTSKIVVFIFAGRRANMEVQRPYLMRLLDQYPTMELHLWDLTREPGDAEYLVQYAFNHERISLMTQLHPGHPIACLYPPNRPPRRRGWPPCECIKHTPPYEKPYEVYAKHWAQEDTVFVKMDDDVLFLETDTFDHLINPLREFPERVISANVVNNAVCAKYARNAEGTRERFDLGPTDDPEADEGWWNLHTLPEFAQWSHGEFLATHTPEASARYVRTREGEKVSINCIAFTMTTMRLLADMFDQPDNTYGDEGAVDSLLPWICLSFTAAHLSFGPQDAAMNGYELDGLRFSYGRLAKGYLA